MCPTTGQTPKVLQVVLSLNPVEPSGSSSSLETTASELPMAVLPGRGGTWGKAMAEASV